MKMKMKIISKNKKQTQKIAGILAGEILKARLNKPFGKPSASAFALALSGDLGSGKTTFAQGFLRALGIKKKITSPTFVLMKNYKIRENSCSNSRQFANCYHVDCYRIKKAADLTALGLKQILKNPENIVLIEWPERIRRALPKNTIQIKFEHGNRENERKISIL